MGNTGKNHKRSLRADDPDYIRIKKMVQHAIMLTANYMKTGTTFRKAINWTWLKTIPQVLKMPISDLISNYC